MPCFGCFRDEQDLKRKPSTSRHSVYGADGRGASASRRMDKGHLLVLEELSESTYGLAVEKAHGKHYEAQDFFAFKEILGSGVFAVVFKAYFKPTGEAYAVKFIANFTQSRQFVSRELCILKLTENCKYLIQYHSHFRVGSNIYFVMELCEGGTLDELLGQKSLMPPRLGRVYLKELSLALMFLHGIKYVHRDVHLGNCLLTKTGHLRLADFGLCRPVDDPNGEMMTVCGRAAIRAPELYLDKLCGFGLDWWSVGIMLYRFITGYFPFQTDKLTQGFQSVTKLKEKYPEWLFDDPSSTEFCQRLLEKDPKLRIGFLNEAHEIKNHPYFKGVNWQHEENIETVLEHDMKQLSKQYIPVCKRLLQILGATNHPLMGQIDTSRVSDISINSYWTKQLKSRDLASILGSLIGTGSNMSRELNVSDAESGV